MTMSDIAYIVAVLENRHETWDQEFEVKKRSKVVLEINMESEE